MEREVWGGVEVGVVWWEVRVVVGVGVWWSSVGVWPMLLSYGKLGKRPDPGYLPDVKCGNIQCTITNTICVPFIY